MVRLKVGWMLMAGAMAIGSLLLTPQETEAGWGRFYRPPARAYRYAYRPVMPHHRAIAPVVVPRAVYRPVAPVVASPYRSGYRAYSPYYSGYRGYSPAIRAYHGYSPYSSGYRGISVNIGYGVAPIGYLGY